MAALPVYQLIANILNFSRSAETLELHSRVGSSFRLLHRLPLNPSDFIDVEPLSQTDKQQLLVTALGSSIQLSAAEQLPDGLHLLLLVLDAWSRAEPVSRLHVYAILLCRFEPKVSAALIVVKKSRYWYSILSFQSKHLHFIYRHVGTGALVSKS